MTAVLLGLLVAASFGSGDFVGGRASRRASTVVVLTVAQACSVVGALALVAVVPGEAATRDLLVGAGAGVFNAAGLGLLYHGLARRAATVVAPLAAVTSAIVPVTWGLAGGERPSGLVLVGIAVALGAVALVSLRRVGDATGPVWPGVRQAVAAGLAFGTSAVLFAEAGHDSGQWPVLAARVAAFASAAALLVAGGRRAARLPRGLALGQAAAAGVLDVAATAVLLVALRRDLLVVVAPVAALAPAFTVVLAWLVTGERVGREQRVGLALALAGLVLIAAG